MGEEYEVSQFSICRHFLPFPLSWLKITHQILCSWVCHMVAGKVEFSPDEDAHVVGDCVKVFSW